VITVGVEVRVAVAVAVICAACARGEPPSWDAAGSSTSAVALPALPPQPVPPATSVTTTIPVASAAESASAATVDLGTLPQTPVEPRASGAAFDARVAAFWDGIVHDDSDRALPFFFPVTAYEQVKDIAHPSADWKHRLVANFRRDVHALHERLGDGAARAKLVKLDVPEGRARWMKPGDEGNKLGYYRVLGSKLRYELDGDDRAFDVTSLISWRGEWYVVHVTGFK